MTKNDPVAVTDFKHMEGIIRNADRRNRRVVVGSAGLPSGAGGYASSGPLPYRCLPARLCAAFRQRKLLAEDRRRH
jgi:hypothetical protein